MTQNTPCIECNKLEEGQRCSQHIGTPVINARICPIEDGTCPTTILKLKLIDKDPRHCGYDAHIIRAKKELEDINEIKDPEIKLIEDNTN